MIDSSRDISNVNEMIIPARYFDEDKLKICNIVYEILEQNKTKSKDIYTSLIEVLKKNFITHKSVICLMTDNAKDMAGKLNGLAGIMKSADKSLHTRTCFCHSLNLIVTNLIKEIYKKDQDYTIHDIRDLVNDNVSLMNYSYKLNDMYQDHCTAYLSDKRKEELYADIFSFTVIQGYADTRFLSLGECTQKFITQWACKTTFYIAQSEAKLKFTAKQQRTFTENIPLFKDNTFKFFFMLLDYIVNTFNTINLKFQKEDCQLHRLYPESKELLITFSKILLKVDVISRSKYYSNTDFNSTNHVDNVTFLTRLQNEMDFSPKNNKFNVDIDLLEADDIKFAKKIIQKICELLIKYHYLNDKTTEALQLIDPRKRNLDNSSSIFRDNLLKIFTNCYDAEHYRQIWED